MGYEYVNVSTWDVGDRYEASIGRDTGGGRDTDVCGPIFVERLKRVGMNVKN